MVRFGIIGCGWFGNVHLDTLLTRPDVQVTALASSNPGKLRATAEKVPAAALFDTPAAMLEAAPLDAVVVCVPPHRHGGLEILAAQKGIHMYIEKPIELDLEHSKATAAVIEKNGVLTAVGYQQRYAEGMDDARRHLAAHPARFLQGTWLGSMPGSPWWRDKAKSGGQIVEQATHMVDLMRYFAGEAEEVAAMGYQNPARLPEGITVDESAAALIRFPGGALASLSVGCFIKQEGFPAMLTFYAFTEDSRLEYLWGEDRPAFTDENALFLTGAGNRDRAMATFVEAVQTGDGRHIRSSYADALETLRLTLAIERAIAEDRCVKLGELA